MLEIDELMAKLHRMMYWTNRQLTQGAPNRKSDIDASSGWNLALAQRVAVVFEV